MRNFLFYLLVTPAVILGTAIFFIFLLAPILMTLFIQQEITIGIAIGNIFWMAIPLLIIAVAWRK